LPPLDSPVAARCWVGAVFGAVYHWLDLPANLSSPAEAVAIGVAQFNLRAIGAASKMV
jgi:hypothetical protein